jgi:xanthine phosphoribosyltransferase
MQELVERIRNEAEYLGKGIIKVDGFLNHQIDPRLTMGMGEAFAQRFADAGVTGITKIVTAEVSGIAPAVMTGYALDVPVVYARKHRPITMPDGYFDAQAPSHTKGNMVNLMISPQYLGADDRVLLIDDFLARGLTIQALAELISKSGAELRGIGCVIEKTFERGRDLLAPLAVPIITLAQIDLGPSGIIVS